MSKGNPLYHGPPQKVHTTHKEKLLKIQPYTSEKEKRKKMLVIVPNVYFKPFVQQNLLSRQHMDGCGKLIFL
jgi:hypothetical protein